jgi:hypothetical protein
MKDVINSIMNNFDFKKVHKTMICLNWRWAGVGGRTPNLDEIKQTAKRLLNNVSDKEPGYSIRTGGFTASKHKDDEDKFNVFLKLRFTVTEFETCHSWVIEQEEMNEE